MVAQIFLSPQVKWSMIISNKLVINYLSIFVTQSLWHSFNLKLEELVYKKALKFIFPYNYFPDLFIEFQIWYSIPFQIWSWTYF